MGLFVALTAWAKEQILVAFISSMIRMMSWWSSGHYHALVVMVALAVVLVDGASAPPLAQADDNLLNDVVVVSQRQVGDDSSRQTDILRTTTSTSSVGNQILSIDDFGAVPDHHVAVKLARHYRRIRERNVDPFHATPTTEWSFKLVETSDMTPLLEQQEEKSLLEAIATTNTQAFNQALLRAQPGDVVLVPDGNSYTMTGGVVGRYLNHVSIDIAGTIHFAYNRNIWPFHNHTLNYGYKPAILIDDSTNVTITSSSKQRAVVYVNYDKNMVYLDRNAGMGGLINGDGKDWWNDAISGRLPSKDGDTRPRLLHIKSCADVVVEYLTLVNSPFWTLTIEAVGAEVGHVNVLVDRRYQTNLFPESSLKSTKEWMEDLQADGMMTVSNQRRLRQKNSFEFVFPVDDLPDWVFRRLRQPQDLNTDGIDPIGMHIRIHDCIVQNADDSVAVKPSSAGVHAAVVNNTIPYSCTHNITIENMVLTGFGASIGSVGPTPHHPCVDSVTFRNITMPGTGKGIYIKSDGSDCHHNVSSRITNILYENIDIRNPFWWAIWIGPQQQHEPNTRIGRKCPLTYPLPGSKHCPTQGCVLFENITLRNVRINDPIISPGVIMGNASNPMRNLIFDNVTVVVPQWKPYHGRWPYHARSYPWRPGFQCENAQGTCHKCQPSPSCFQGDPAEV